MKAKVYVAPHFHCDPVWLGDQNTCIWRSMMNSDEFVECCLEDPLYHAVLTEVDYLKPYVDYMLDRRNALKVLIAEGRIETAGSYSEPNEVSLGLEAIIRNLALGKTFHEEQLGDKPTVYQPHDVFGHCRRIAQLLKGFGFRGMVYTKGNPPAFIDYPFPRLFRYLSPDGSELILKREPYHPLTFVGGLEQAIEHCKQHQKEEAAAGVPTDLLMIGSDFEPPREWLTGNLKYLAEQDPPIVISVPGKYFDAIHHAVDHEGLELPLTSRDIHHYHIGTSVSRSNLKLGNRLGENRVYQAEAFASIASLMGADYPHLALDKAWRQLAFVHHHDSITGTQSDRPFLDLLSSYRESLELSSEVLENACRFIASKAETRMADSDAQALVVFNALPRKRSGPCELTVEGEFGDLDVFESSGRIVPHQVFHRDIHGVTIRFWAEDVPALGYKSYYYQTKEPRTHEPRLDCETTIENEFFRITVDPARGGGIVSLWDKQEGRELIQSTSKCLGNDIALLIEGPGVEPSWEFHTTGEKHFASEAPAQVTRLTGTVAQKLIIESTLAEKHELVREIALYEGCRTIEFETRLVNYQTTCPPENNGAGEDPRRDFVLACFPLELEGTTPVYDDRNTLLARKRSRKQLEFDTSQWKMYSGCAVYSASHFAGLGSCVTLDFGEGGSFPLGLGAVITADSEGGRVLGERLIKAFNPHGITLTQFTPEQDFNADTFYQTFRLAAGLEGENSYLERLRRDNPAAAERLAKQLGAQGYCWVAVLDQDVPQGAGNADDWNHGKVSAATVPWSMDPLPVLVLVAKDEASLEAALAELELDLADAKIELPKEANFSGLWNEVPGYTAAVINNGNLGMSVEAGDLVTLALFHVAAWSNRYFADVFVDEMGTRVFRYALHCAPGGVRDSGLLEAAESFQHDLLPFAVDQHRGDLPKEKALMQVEPTSVALVTLKAPGYPVMAGQSKQLEGPLTEVIIRLAEQNGRPTLAEVLLPAAPERVVLCDLAENELEELPAGSSKLEIPLVPNAIATVKLTFGNLPECENVTLGRLHEPCQPVCVRYWELNQGAAPIGNMPVALALFGPTATEHENVLQLGLANNYTDREVEAVVKLALPSGCFSEIKEVPFRLAPGETKVEEVVVKVRHSCPGGWIMAQVEHEGQLYQDYLEVHRPTRLAVAGLARRERHENHGGAA